MFKAPTPASPRCIGESTCTSPTWKPYRLGNRWATRSTTIRAASVGSSRRQEEAVAAPTPEAGELARIDPPGIGGDATARTLAEDVGQARDREPRGPEQIGQDITGAHARQLIGIADEEEVGTRRDGFDELVGKHGIEHADFVHDDQVRLQRMVRAVLRLAARTQAEDAMQRPCRAGRSPHSSAWPPARWARPARSAAAWPWPASAWTGGCASCPYRGRP